MESRVKRTEMLSTLRLLIPDKKGIYKRIAAAVQEAGGHIQHSWLKRQMRGMSEAEIDIRHGSDVHLPSILSALGRIPGVALLGSPGGTRGVISAGSRSESAKGDLRDGSTPDPSP